MPTILYYLSVSNGVCELVYTIPWSLSPYWEINWDLLTHSICTTTLRNSHILRLEQERMGL